MFLGVQLKVFSDSETELLSDYSDEFSSSESESKNVSQEDERDWCTVNALVSKPSLPRFSFTCNLGLKFNVRDNQAIPFNISISSSMQKLYHL